MNDSYIDFRAISDSRIKVYKDSEDLGEILYAPKDKDALFLNDPSIANIIDVSVDGKYVVVGEDIFVLEKNLRLASWLPQRNMQDDPDNEELLSVIFLGNRHIAVGYSTGRIFIYKVRDGKSAEFCGILEHPKKKEAFVELPLSTYANGRCVVAGIGRHIIVWSSKKDSADKNTPDKIWERIEKTPIVPDTVIENAHNEEVYCLSVAANEKELISGSKDKTAKVWNLVDKSLLGTFKESDDPVEYVGFVENSNQFYAATSSGRLYVWAFGDDSSERYKKEEIIYSPYLFEAEAASIKDYLPVKYYDTSSTKEYYISVLNYMISLPVELRKQDVTEYENALTNSLRDIDRLIPALINRKDFFHVINKSQRQLLYNEYYKIEKLRNWENTLERKRLKLYSKFVKELQQENDILIALDLINNLGSLLDIPVDPEEDMERYKILESAFNNALKKSPGNKQINEALEKCRINQSYLHILNQGYSQASDCLSQVKSPEIREERDFIRVQFLLNSLQKGELVMPHLSDKKHPYQNNTSSYDEVFMDDLKKIKEIKKDSALVNRIDQLIMNLDRKMTN